jgi:hypothetical protein
MKTNIFRPLACCILILFTSASLLQADRAADVCSKIIPPGAVMTPLMRKSARLVPWAKAGHVENQFAGWR